MHADPRGAAGEVPHLARAGVEQRRRYDPAFADDGQHLTDQRRHLRAVTGLAHTIDHTIGLSGAREPVKGHIHKAAPAIVDVDIPQIREGLGQ